VSVMRPARRRFIQAGGALVVLFALPPRARAALPGDLEKTPQLDAWLRIGSDGTATLFTGKAELGQGIKTALLQIAAEQLALPIERIQLVTADTERTPNEGYTAGSHSMQDSGVAILHAAAQARDALVAEAAQRLGVPAQSLRAENGSVRAEDGRSLAYGALVSDGLLAIKAQPGSRLATARAVMGKPVARVDIPAKVTGGVAYVQDLRLPGMLHARVLRPPGYGARIASLDAGIAERMPGVVKVVRDGDFVAVVASGEWQAIRAMRALKDATRWQENAKLPDAAGLRDALLAAHAEDTVIAGGGAPAPASGRVLEASYLRPYQMHASIGPSCAVAQLQDGKLGVWTHSQGVYPLRDALAELLRMPKEAIHCIHLEGSGCYGHNAADDVAADAALLARALPGKPVRVQWMREDEHGWEPFGPAMLTRLRATLDDAGRLAGWQHEVWSATHSTRPAPAGNLAAAWSLKDPFAQPEPKPIPQPEGGGDRNAIPLYEFPNTRVVHHFLPAMPLRVSALRGLGAYMNVFSIESFVDELARAQNADPVEFRLQYLRDPRAIEVVKRAAEKFGWTKYRRSAHHGRGFAFGRYKNLAAYAALAMEVAVEPLSGDLRVLRVAAAIDSGEAVNPDGVRNQTEGGILQSISWTTFEAVGFDAARITSRDWARYPILRFSHVPQSVAVEVIDRPGEPFLGTGEAMQGPTAGALANALADASGVRFRELPFDRRRVKAALRPGATS
jgi:nicotinate dehydrogenase subunit B